MNILVVSPFNIYPPSLGFATRVYNLTKQLSTRHSVHFLYVDLDKKHIECGDHTPIPNVVNYRVKTSKRWMQLFHPLLIVKGLKIVKNEDIDLIIAESIWAGFHSIILHKVTKIPYYFNEQNAEYVRWKRMGKKGCMLIKFYEIFCCKYAEKIFCVSGTDKELISNLGIEINKLTIVPNGVDTNRFKPDIIGRNKIRISLGLSDETPIILFFGYFGYSPNLQAVKIIHETLSGKIIRKIPNAKFLIVGSNPPLQYNSDSIIFTGAVDKIEDYINASDVVIAPLLSGGGTKLKVLESIACGQVVVTTSIGAEGLTGEESDKFLLVTDDWDRFIDYVIESLQNPKISEKPSKFIKCYSWDSVGQIFCEEVSKLN